MSCAVPHRMGRSLTPRRARCHDMDEKGFRQLAVEALAWLRGYPQRAAGLGLFFLGCLLAALVRGGGDPLRDFASGAALGLGVGCMAVGAVFLALSLRNK